MPVALAPSPQGADPAAARAGADAAWRAFTAELDRWAAAGRVATFWWRDDDASDVHPGLDRLLDLAGRRPLALAAIPASLTAALAADLSGAPASVRVLPHGLRHANRAPEGARKAEFGSHRPVPEMLAEIGAGRARLAAMLGARMDPIFVPPWNRMAPDLAARLPAAGLAVVSAHGGRPRGGRGVRRLDTHIDILDWRGGRGFIGTAAALDRARGHLAARRTGAPGTDPAEPTGLLTHHRVHDAGCWAFLADFLAVLDAHPAARLVPAAGGLAR